MGLTKEQLSLFKKDMKQYCDEIDRNNELMRDKIFAPKETEKK